LGAQKIALNQFLENPISPKALTTITKRTPSTQDTLNTRLNTKNSQTNFSVPGIPEKKKIIKIIESAKLLKEKKIPLTARMDLDLYLAYIHSTKKNISVDKKACIMLKRKPYTTIFESPFKKKIASRFISCIVQ
jgi:hypothetical protein